MGTVFQSTKTREHNIWTENPRLKSSVDSQASREAKGQRAEIHFPQHLSFYSNRKFMTFTNSTKILWKGIELHTIFMLGGYLWQRVCKRFRNLMFWLYVIVCTQEKVSQRMAMLLFLSGHGCQGHSQCAMQGSLRMQDQQPLLDLGKERFWG